MKRVKEVFKNAKLNIKFTAIIILFTLIPIGIFAGILFYTMEQNVIDENLNYMEYTMKRSQDAIATKIDSINMPTQFFLSDEGLLNALRQGVKGQERTPQEWIDFKNGTVAPLERLVNNNPLLYGARVYADNDNVQEMMPILYKASRMQKQPWAAAIPPGGSLIIMTIFLLPIP